MENKTQINSFNDLPTEIWLKILNYVEPKWLLKCCQVSKRWNQLCNDPLIWYAKCLEIKLPNLFEYQAYMSHANESLKIQYWTRYWLLANWQHGKKVSPIIVAVHGNRLITDLALLGKMVASCSDDGCITVLDASSGQKMHEFHGHKGGVWAMTILVMGTRQFLVTSGSDCILRIWLMRNDGRCECLHALRGHEATVRCLAAVYNDIHDDPYFGQAWIVSGSRDSTLRIWDVHEGRCVHILEGHSGAVRCVRADTEHVISGSYDYTLRIWLIQSGVCIRVLEGHTGRVYTAFLGCRVIVSTSLDTTVRLWQRPSVTEIGRDGDYLQPRVLCGHRSVPSTIAMDTEQTLVVSGGADGSVRVWCVLSGNCLFQCGPGGVGGSGNKNGHLTGITTVHVVLDRFIVSASVDGMLKLWNLVSGTFIRDIFPSHYQNDGISRTTTTITIANAASAHNNPMVIWRSVSDNMCRVVAAGSCGGPENSNLVLFNFSAKTNNENSQAIF